jgi:hypothetical protein
MRHARVSTNGEGSGNTKATDKVATAMLLHGAKT